MTWVYLSPHFDDVALSCGGLIWEQFQAGEMVNIWTVCAGDAPPGDLSPFAQQLHARWEAGSNAPHKRRIEDINSCRRLGASYRHFTIPDCIYRRHPHTGEYMYASEEALNGPLHPGDAVVIHNLQMELQRSMPPDTTVVCPLALGNHVDHQLTRRAADGLGWKLRYYADFPYILRGIPLVEQMEAEGWLSEILSISPAGLAAWQASIRAHASQISTFWASALEMEQAVSQYLESCGGAVLWSKLDS